MRLGRLEGRRRGGDVQRVTVLADVGDPDRRHDVGGQEAGGLTQRRRVGIEQRGRRPGGVEEAGKGGGDPSEAQPR